MSFGPLPFLQIFSLVFFDYNINNITPFGAFECPQSPLEANSAGQRSKKPSSLGPGDPPPPLKVQDPSIMFL
jgi:hypothetical protein